MKSVLILVIAGAVASAGCHSKRSNPNMSEMEEVVADARDDAFDDGTGSAVETQEAEVVEIDRDAEMVTLRLEGDSEIALQSGREIRVPFSDLSSLTGIAKDEAVDQLHEGEEVEVGFDALGNLTTIDAGWEDEVFPRDATGVEK